MSALAGLSPSVVAPDSNANLAAGGPNAASVDAAFAAVYAGVMAQTASQGGVGTAAQAGTPQDEAAPKGSGGMASFKPPGGRAMGLGDGDALPAPQPDALGIAALARAAASSPLAGSPSGAVSPDGPPDSAAETPLIAQCTAGKVPAGPVLASAAPADAVTVAPLRAGAIAALPAAEAPPSGEPSTPAAPSAGASGADAPAPVAEGSAGAPEPGAQATMAPASRIKGTSWPQRPPAGLAGAEPQPSAVALRPMAAVPKAGPAAPPTTASTPAAAAPAPPLPANSTAAPAAAAAGVLAAALAPAAQPEAASAPSARAPAASPRPAISGGPPGASVAAKPASVRHAYASAGAKAASQDSTPAPPDSLGAAAVAPAGPTPALPLAGDPAQQVAAALKTLLDASNPGPARSSAGSLAEAAAPGQAALASPSASAAPGHRVVEIQLAPESLGAVSIKMRLTGDRIDVEIVVANAQTLEVLSKDRHVLSAAIETAGGARNSLVLMPQSKSGGEAVPAEPGGSQASPDRGGQGASSSAASPGGGGQRNGRTTRSASSNSTRANDNVPNAAPVANRLGAGLYV